MNADIIKGHWKELKGKVRQQWGKFTDDEIEELAGTREELEGSLQKKYGYGKARARKELDDFLDKNDIH